jgi:hypothetical protein
MQPFGTNVVSALKPRIGLLRAVLAVPFLAINFREGHPPPSSPLGGLSWHASLQPSGGSAHHSFLPETKNPLLLLDSPNRPPYKPPVSTWRGTPVSIETSNWVEPREDHSMKGGRVAWWEQDRWGVESDSAWLLVGPQGRGPRKGSL